MGQRHPPAFLTGEDMPDTNVANTIVLTDRRLANLASDPEVVKIVPALSALSPITKGCSKCRMKKYKPQLRAVKTAIFSMNAEGRDRFKNAINAGRVSMMVPMAGSEAEFNF